MLTFRDFITGLRKLEIDQSRPVIAHTSLSAFGEVHGGVETVLGALSSSFNTLVMPVFTYKTMITPEVGPPDNGINYGSGKDTNRMAEIYRADMPADKMMGVVAESLRTHPKAFRSSHPILSFTGINARPILDSQSIKEPLLPIQKMVEQEGWVLLLGVDQTANTSIHYAEQLAGRRSFIRWALTVRGVIPCQRFPGCSDGFEELAPLLEGVIRKVELGDAMIQAIPVGSLVDAVGELLKEHPLALLCGREDCERCNAVRASVAVAVIIQEFSTRLVRFYLRPLKTHVSIEILCDCALTNTPKYCTVNLYILEEGMTIHTTYTQTRASLAKLLDKVTHDREVVIIQRRGEEEVAMIAASELSSLMETAYLLRSPVNAERLLSALGRALKNEGKPLSLDTLRREVKLEA